MVAALMQAVLLFSVVSVGVGMAFTVLLGEADYGDEGPEFGSTFAIPWFSIYGYLNPGQHLTPFDPLNRRATLV